MVLVAGGQQSRNTGRIMIIMPKTVPIIRDSAARCLQLGENTFDEVEKILFQYPWDVFTRIYIHLCRTFAAAAGGQRIRSLLTDHKFFNNYRYKHEWSLLLGEQFKNLSDEDKNVILGWCDNELTKSPGLLITNK